MTLQWFALSILSLPFLEAARFESHSTVFRIDCSQLEPPSTRTHTKKIRSFRNWYWWTNVPDDKCKETFVYDENRDDFYSLIYQKDWVPDKSAHMSDSAFKAFEYCHTGDLCEVPEGGVVWKYAKKLVHEKCKEMLCDLAKTGKWKAGWFKQSAAKSTPWHRTMPGHKSYGYEDVFKLKCWRGPERLGELLGNFEEFADKYDLINKDSADQTADQTFNKKVCGCHTVDNCGGYYKPGEQ